MFLLWFYCDSEVMSLVISCVLTLCIVRFTSAWLRATLYWNDDHITTKTHTMLQCTRWEPLVSIYNETLRLFVDGWMMCVSPAASVVSRSRVRASTAPFNQSPTHAFSVPCPRRRWIGLLALITDAEIKILYNFYCELLNYRFWVAFLFFPNENKNLAKFLWIC